MRIAQDSSLTIDFNNDVHVWACADYLLYTVTWPTQNTCAGWSRGGQYLLCLHGRISQLYICLRMRRIFIWHGLRMRRMKQRRTIFALPSWQNISTVYLFAHVQNIYVTWPSLAQDEAEEDDIRSAFMAEYLICISVWRLRMCRIFK